MKKNIYTFIYNLDCFHGKHLCAEGLTEQMSWWSWDKTFSLTFYNTYCCDTHNWVNDVKKGKKIGNLNFDKKAGGDKKKTE